jgi:hypothetical protein
LAFTIADQRFDTRNAARNAFTAVEMRHIPAETQRFLCQVRADEARAAQNQNRLWPCVAGQGRRHGGTRRHAGTDL